MAVEICAGSGEPAFLLFNGRHNPSLVVCPKCRARLMPRIEGGYNYVPDHVRPPKKEWPIQDSTLGRGKSGPAKEYEDDEQTVQA